jgi:hypothetical protein
MWVIILKSLRYFPSGPSFRVLASRSSSLAAMDFKKRTGSRTMFSRCLRFPFR